MKLQGQPPGASIKAASSNFATTKSRIGKATFQAAEKVSEIAKKTSEDLLLLEGDHLKWIVVVKKEESEDVAN
jgi:hypothetical protein